MADESLPALAQGNEYSRGAYLTKRTKSSRKLEGEKEREEAQVHIIYVVEVEFVETVLELLHYGCSENSAMRNFSKPTPSDKFSAAT